MIEKKWNRRKKKRMKNAVMNEIKKKKLQKQKREEIKNG